MNPKEMYFFLGRCLILDEFPETRPELIDLMNHNRFSWDQFVRTGSNNLVLPALYLKFLNADLLQYIPDDLSVYLREIFERNQERNKQIKLQIGSVNEVLHSCSIYPVYIKGAASLLEGLYNHPAERMMTDIDLVVPEDQAEQAIKILKGDGYSSEDFRAEDFPFMHHYPTLFRKNKVASIDVHRSPLSDRYQKHLGPWESRKVNISDDKGQKIFTCALPDRMALNFLHSQWQDHGQYFARVSLKNIYEMYRLLLGVDVIDEVKTDLKPLQRSFNNYLGLAARLFYPFEVKGYQPNVLSRIYMARIVYNKSSRVYYHLSKTARIALAQLGYYLRLIRKSVFSSVYRRYLMVRLKDNSWLAGHLTTVWRRFH